METEHIIKLGDRIQIRNFSPAIDGCKGKVIELEGDYIYADIEVENDLLRFELYECEVELI